MRLLIQNLVLPTEPKHKTCRELFYRGGVGVIDKQAGALTLGFAQTVDFTTYLNACSWQKWQRYTCAQKLQLHLRLRGKAKVTTVGYHKDGLEVVRRDFGAEVVDFEATTEYKFTFPENDEQMVGFEVAPLAAEVELAGGYFTAEAEAKALQEVKLAIATTTCRKEDFIRKNVALIRQELLGAGGEIADNLYLHVVDNGQTLEKKDVSGRHVYLHPNPNVGGSGGFARGMLEAMRQKPAATHVLLMDDDVLVLPESIYRTYMLLRMMRPEYRGAFVNGAMLYYEEPGRQHEDVGTVQHDNGKILPLKGQLDQKLILDNLTGESIDPLRPGAYSAWWFCCVPMTEIRERGLPLPLFLRYDDVEFGVRRPTEIIAMNGICVWHQSFAAKHSNMTRYFDRRNYLVVAATSDVFDVSAVLTDLVGEVRRLLMSFRYEAAEAIIKALEDFLKGSDFLRRPNGEQLIKSCSKFGEQLRPLSEFSGMTDPVCYNAVWENPPLTNRTRRFLRLTWNGQIGNLPYHAKQTPGIVGFDGFFQPERVAYCEEILAVDLVTMQGILYQKDRPRFLGLYRRYQKAMKELGRRWSELEAEYQDAAEELTSVEFWEEYLEITQE